VELIFFPRTWKQVRAMVELDRVYLVMGKVRTENGDRPQIIVERIQNDLTVARPADLGAATVTPASPSPDEPPAEPPAAAPEAPQVRPIEQPAAATTGGPPPPPNFEPDAYLYSTPRGPAATLESPPAAMSEAPSPAAAQTGEERAARPSPVVVQAPAMKPVPTEPVADKEMVNGSPRVVVVQIRPDDGWRETCRQVVHLAGRYEGHDSLRIMIWGHAMAMEFPNVSTCYCPELIDDVRRLATIASVEAI
ncbi:MAG: hypothetical protein ACK2UH_14005, partial [Candidatus Promineifilaceae bacterium]